MIYDKDEAIAITNLAFEKTLNLPSKNDFYQPHLQQKYFAQLQNCLFRLLANEPLQHILEESFFLNCKLKVNKNVLIPRPETEELVLLFIKAANEKNISSFQIIDVCSGSGCIAIAVAKAFPKATIFALEKSEKALSVAKENALTNQVEINFLQQDFFDFASNEKFDFIISNPPYIKEDEMKSMDKNVLLFEPQEALFVSNQTPLIFYHQLKKLADENLKQQGLIYLEVNAELANEVKNLFGENYSAIIQHDMFGKSRFVIAVKNN